MLGLGPAELIIVVLTLFTGVGGMDQTAKGPSPDEVASFAPSDADYMFYGHAQAVLKPSVKLIRRLPKHRAIRSVPPLRRFTSTLVEKLDRGIGEFRLVTGMNPIKSLDWVAAWLQVPEEGAPRFMLVLKGGFDAPRMLAGAAKLGQRISVGDQPAVRLGSGGPVLAVAGEGAIVMGTDTWVARHLSRKGAPPPAPEAIVTRSRDLLSANPILLLASRPSKPLARLLKRRVRRSGGPLVADLLTGHHYLGLAVTPTGLLGRLAARDQEGLTQAKMASQGAIEVLRAGHFGLRGAARLLLAGLHSYKTLDPVYRAILKHEKLLLDLVFKNTGDGRFDARIKASTKTLTLDVSATGKAHINEVLSQGAIMAFVAVGAAWTLSANEVREEAPLRPSRKQMKTRGKRSKRVRARRLKSRPRRARPLKMDINPEPATIRPPSD